PGGRSRRPPRRRRSRPRNLIPANWRSFAAGGRKWNARTVGPPGPRQLAFVYRWGAEMERQLGGSGRGEAGPGAAFGGHEVLRHLAGRAQEHRRTGRRVVAGPARARVAGAGEGRAGVHEGAARAPRPRRGGGGGRGPRWGGGDKRRGDLGPGGSPPP